MQLLTNNALSNNALLTNKPTNILSQNLMYSRH